MNPGITLQLAINIAKERYPEHLDTYNRARKTILCTFMNYIAGVIVICSLIIASGMMMHDPITGYLISIVVGGLSVTFGIWAFLAWSDHNKNRLIHKINDEIILYNNKVSRW